jgi:hypothetical protein
MKSPSAHPKGSSTKIHLRAKAADLPIGVVGSAGEAHDCTAYADLMDERESDPGVLLTDRGYDSDAIRQDARDRGAQPEIPAKRTDAFNIPSAARSALCAIASSAAATNRKMPEIEKCLARRHPIRSNRQQLPQLRPARQHPYLGQVCPRVVEADRPKSTHGGPAA